MIHQWVKYTLLVVILLSIQNGVLAQDTIILRYPNQSVINSDSIVKLENIKIGSTLFNLIKTNSQSHDVRYSPTEIKTYRNAIIEEIEVITLNPFGPTITSPNKTSENFLGKLANRTRFKTNEYVIMNNLLFSVGDSLSPMLISDTERILRQLNFIKNAHIEIIPIIGNEERVKLVVWVKDLYPLGLGFDIRSTDEGKLDFWNSNIFGTGYYTKHSIYWDVHEPDMLGIHSRLRINNISRTFTSLDFNYLDEFGNQGYWVNIDRRFFAPGARFAGGFEIKSLKQFKEFRTLDTVYFEQFTHEKSVDLWLGKSFEILNPKIFNRYRTSIVFAGRIWQKSFIERPDFVDDQSFYGLYNRQAFLGSVSIIQQRFLRTNLIYSFGRTEDLPFGYNLSMYIGYENEEFANRTYYGLSYSGGKYHYRLGYLYGKFHAGGFVNNAKAEQVMTKCSILYFTNLIGTNRFKFRFFNQFDYTYGHNTYVGDITSINGIDGIRGLFSGELYGNEKMTGLLEAVMFTPYKPAGFRVTLYSFANWGIVNNNYERLFKNEFYSSVGLGFRIRNENLVLNTIQIKFTYYLNQSDNISTKIFDIAGAPRIRPASFYTEKPEFLLLR